MQSSDVVSLVAVNHRIAIAWFRCADLKRLPTASRLSKGLRLRVSNASVISTLTTDASQGKVEKLQAFKALLTSSRVNAAKTFHLDNNFPFGKPIKGMLIRRGLKSKVFWNTYVK